MADSHGELKKKAEAFYVAYNRRDWDGVFADADPEVEWDPVEENVSYRGRPAILDYFERWLDTWVDFRVELEELVFTPDEDRMFSAVRYVGRSPESDVESDGHFFA